VERAFAWLRRCRPLSKDYKRSLRVSETWVRIAMIQHMVRRLEPLEMGYTPAEKFFQTPSWPVQTPASQCR